MPTYGIENLFVEQKKALSAFVSGKDVFVNLPTGFGKSLIFQMAPFVHAELAKFYPKGGFSQNPIVIVICPLLNLMEDQKQYLKKLGIAAASIGENEVENLRVERGECSLVYTSPESLLANSRWRNMLSSDIYKNNLVGIVVDEAHCISHWNIVLKQKLLSVCDILILI